MPYIIIGNLPIPSTVAKNDEIEANTFLGFVYNSIQVTVEYTAPTKTTCYGNICDCQRVVDWLGSKGCGCYGMSTNITSLDIHNYITVNNTNNGTLGMSESTYFKFSQLYTGDDITGSCKLYMLQITDAGMDMLSTLE